MSTGPGWTGALKPPPMTVAPRRAKPTNRLAPPTEPWQRRSAPPGCRSPGVDLADLAVGTVHMDQLLMRQRNGKQGVAVGGHLAEADVDREDHVGIAQQRLDVRCHADTRLADKDRRVVVELVLVAERGNHGDIGAFANCKTPHVPRAPIGAADEKHRPLAHFRASPGPRQWTGIRRPGSNTTAGLRSGATSVVAVSMSSGSATTTGPGRPPSAVVQARARISGRRTTVVDLDRPFRQACRTLRGSRPPGTPRAPAYRCRPGRRTEPSASCPASRCGHRSLHWRRRGRGSRSRCQG